jgi:RHS repeat-associated protein
MPPVTVTVVTETGDPYPGLQVYSFDGEIYTGVAGVSDVNGEVIFTLPEGAYRFRADYNGSPFWSDEVNHCTVPSCSSASVEISEGLEIYQVTIDYTYDLLNRLIAADYDDGTFFHYTYDAIGNRLTQETLAKTNTYNYDTANRLIEVDGQPYTWDNNGNLLSNGVRDYSYNYANKLINVSMEGADYSYAYNGMGDRLQQVVDGNVTNYSLDINRSLPQVLMDDSYIYLYGNGDRISQKSSSSIDFFVGDVLGSVRQLSDISGNVTLALAYQPFGEVYSIKGKLGSSYGYAGEWTDQTGLIHLRARYYNPSDGRFLTKDIWQGSIWQPISNNPWLYVNSNPINYIDPSGYQGDDPVGTPEPPGPTVTPEPPGPTVTPEPDRPPTPEIPEVPPEPVKITTWRNMSLNELISYQQNQGPTNHCALYSISTAFNLLYGLNTTGQDIVDVIKPGGLLKYYYCPDGGCVQPHQQARIVNNLSSTILKMKRNLPSAKVKHMSNPALLNALSNPNQLVIMTFNTNSLNPISGHAVLLVAHKTDKQDVNDDGFGFLNSGWGRRQGRLFWQSHDQMRVNRQSPLLFGNGFPISPFSGHFVEISLNGRNKEPICPVYPDPLQ